MGSSSCLQLHWDGAQCNDRLYIDLVFGTFHSNLKSRSQPRHEEFHQTRTCSVRGQRPVRENSGPTQPETATSSDDPPRPQSHALLP